VIQFEVKRIPKIIIEYLDRKREKERKREKRREKERKGEKRILRHFRSVGSFHVIHPLPPPRPLLFLWRWGGGGGRWGVAENRAGSLSIPQENFGELHVTWPCARLSLSLSVEGVA